ncbi:MAG: hypothetical protein KGO02_08165 [Alphaproteobacteria bacterium]|nr:hypothetical protein [Alphaproteobacteria bacterium]
MIYTMTVREAFRPGGASFDIATTEVGGKVYEAESKNGSTMRLARQMVQDGLPDGAWQVVNDQGHVRFYGPSLYRLAKLTVHETDKQGPRLRPYREFSGPTATPNKALEEAST